MYFQKAPNQGETMAVKLVAAIGYYFTARSCEIVNINFEDIKIEDGSIQIKIIRTKTDRAQVGE